MSRIQPHSGNENGYRLTTSRSRFDRSSPSLECDATEANSFPLFVSWSGGPLGMVACLTSAVAAVSGSEPSDRSISAREESSLEGEIVVSLLSRPPEPGARELRHDFAKTSVDLLVISGDSVSTGACEILEPFAELGPTGIFPCQFLYNIYIHLLSNRQTRGNAQEHLPAGQ